LEHNSQLFRHVHIAVVAMQEESGRAKSASVCRHKKGGGSMPPPFRKAV
jgi:hypothetical protein